MAVSHKDILSSLHSQLKGVFEGSQQGMYIYLDDANIVCNNRFAKMLGYSSAKEWAAAGSPFPLVFVSDESRHALVHAYRAAMEQKVGSTIVVSWLKKGGGKVKTSVILVPVAYDGHLFALHFVDKV